MIIKADWGYLNADKYEKYWIQGNLQRRSIEICCYTNATGEPDLQKWRLLNPFETFAEVKDYLEALSMLESRLLEAHRCEASFVDLSVL